MTGGTDAPLLVVLDERFLEHDTGPGHPENAGRLAQALAVVESWPAGGLRCAEARPATREELLALHEPGYVAQVEATAGRRVQLDADTTAGPRSFETARLAAGAVVQATEAVLAGEARGALALVRPPGHHAEAGRAAGFCLFNNVAIAAALASTELGCRRVLVLDPDIHHGNGTQRAFEERDDVLYVSSHRFPYYPGTGWYDELGRGRGAGFTVNLPMPMGLGDAELVHLYRHAVEPIVDAFRPELILVSAGFDTWRGDPIGDLAVTEAGFAALFALFRGWADAHCPGRMVCALEGGYDPAGVAAGVRAVLAAGTAPHAPPAELAATPGPEARAIVERARATLAPFWPSLRG